jgi:hypothetical protein
LVALGSYIDRSAEDRRRAHSTAFHMLWLASENNLQTTPQPRPTVRISSRHHEHDGPRTIEVEPAEHGPLGTLRLDDAGIAKGLQWRTPYEPSISAR